MSTLGHIFYLSDKVIIIWADPIAHLMHYELNYHQFQRLIVDTPIHVYLDIYWDHHVNVCEMFWCLATIS